jgi:DNA polymerase III subunit delta
MTDVSRSETRGAAPRPVREPLKAAYLIVGDDLPKIEAALKRLKQRIVQESGSDLNISEFEAPDDPGLTVVNAANTMAFLGGTRLVMVHHAEAWAKAEKDQIAGYLSSPAPDACLALVAAKLPPSDPLRAAMEKHGQVLEYLAPKEAELPFWLQREASRIGVQLGVQQARLLVNRCGDNQNILLREVEKLDLYAEGRRITDDDILLLTHASYEASIFDLLDSLALGRGAAAFSAADELLASGERHEVLFYRIMRHFQQLSRVAALRDAGYAREAIQAEMKLKAFPARKLAEQASLLGAEGIARRLAVLAETDARMKGMGNLPDDMELQLCLGRLLAA